MDRIEQLEHDLALARSAISELKAQLPANWEDRQRAASNTIGEFAIQALNAESKAAKLGKCLAFFASVIKSGEPWTETCEREYKEATSP